jgi:hypothetical protein
MKHKATISPYEYKQDSRSGAVRIIGFPAAPMDAGKSRVKGESAAARTAQLCDSAFLADRGCLGRAIPPKHTGPAVL